MEIVYSSAILSHGESRVFGVESVVGLDDLAAKSVLGGLLRQQADRRAAMHRAMEICTEPDAVAKAGQITLAWLERDIRIATDVSLAGIAHCLQQDGGISSVWHDLSALFIESCEFRR